MRGAVLKWGQWLSVLDAKTVTASYDVIIVGGRISGSALAITLGRANLRVLLLERDVLPSLPAASSPVIYAPAMSLLDQLGVPESAYTHNTPRIDRWVIEAQDVFRVEQPIPHICGRDYAYAIDRARFDNALWERAHALPTVDARTHCAVVDLLQDGARVVGVEVRDTLTDVMWQAHAPLVVGADGRFSTVARKVRAAEYDRHNQQPTSVYYAYWRGVRPLETEGSAAHLFSTGGDYGLLIMPSADDSTVVVIEGRTDRLQSDKHQTVEAFYCAFLQAHPSIWARLEHAERVTPVHGMKRIGNLYRQAGGEGWALVGDAIHQKDPLDGQGIYDALFTAQTLAQQLIRVHEREIQWETALANYTYAVRAETYPMYHATLARVNRELYTRRSGWFMQWLARWLYEDPIYRQRWARLFVRDISPKRWFAYHVVMLALVRGIWRDLKRLFARAPRRSVGST